MKTLLELRGAVLCGSQARTESQHTPKMQRHLVKPHRTNWIKIPLGTSPM